MNQGPPLPTTICASNQEWYVCSAGGFEGCCSSDPCTSGICPDEAAQHSALTTTSRAPTATTRSTSTTSSTSSDIAQTTSTTSTSSTSPTTADQTSSAGAASTTGTESATPTSGGSKSSSNAALIGGVVGGIIALLLCAILFWFCWRRRRREQAFNIVSMHRSVSSQSLHEPKTTSPMKPSPNQSGANTFRRNTDSLAPSTTGSNANTTISAPDSWSLSIPGLTNSGPSEASTLSSGMTLNKPQNTRDLPPIPQESELPGTLPRGAGFTPELPETTVSRTRAELPSHPRSELINVPLSERMRLSAQSLRPGPGPGFQRQQHQSGSSSRSWDSPSTSASANASPYPSPSTTAATSTTSPALMTRSTARRIVTDDGIVLGANLDRYSVPTGPDAEQGRHGNEEANGGRRERNAQDHVMSFMDFEEGAGPGDGGDRLYRRYGDGEEGPRVTMPEAYTRAVEGDRAARDEVLLEGDSFSPNSDAPPAYESGSLSPRDRKSPSATMGLGLRGMERE